jgi:hypothetical protein
MDFEQEILNGLHGGIQKVIQQQLGSYDSPLQHMTEEVMEKNKSMIIQKMDKAFKSVIENPDFEKILQEEFSHHIARILISKMDGLTEKTASEIKNNPVTKAKLLLAIQKIIDK